MSEKHEENLVMKKKSKKNVENTKLLITVKRSFCDVKIINYHPKQSPPSSKSILINSKNKFIVQNIGMKLVKFHSIHI